MIHILARVAVGDVARFLEIFGTEGADLRARHGSLGSQVFRLSGDDTHLVIFFRWESLEAFNRFRQDPAVRESMEAAGTSSPPAFTFLDKIAEFKD